MLASPFFSLTVVLTQLNYKTFFSMLTPIRFFVTICLIALIVPQTNTENALLRAFNSSNLFKNYGEAKTFLRSITWLSIFLYIVLTYLATIT
ncbi:hypothetical protein COCOBI_pt-0700 (chloroplast) [Coccomyxa sp. Obi]|nr:hypothetical protein COCOBI_pt-0700 [Coccomyxa sp. Obi]